MPLKSKQAIIEQMTTSALNMRKVRERAQQFKQAQLLGEPDVIATAQGAIVPGSPIQGETKG